MNTRLTWSGETSEHRSVTSEHRSALWLRDVLGGSVQPRSVFLNVLSNDKSKESGHVLWHGHGQREYKSVLWASTVRHRSMLWRDNEDLKHEQEQEMELARCWRDASDDTMSGELKHEPKDKVDLVRCWRDA